MNNIQNLADKLNKLINDMREQGKDHPIFQNMEESEKLVSELEDNVSQLTKLYESEKTDEVCEADRCKARDNICKLE